jgi:predicted ATP-grasp superfamily ATP-dependent carboligase
MPTGFDSIKFLAANQIFQNTINIPPKDLIESLDNKAKFSNFCKKNHLPYPLTTTFDKNTLSVLRFPFLAKHIYGAGRDKLFKIHSLEDFNTLKNRLETTYFIAQQFIEGTDYAFNAYCTNGKITAWSIQEFVTARWKGRNRLRLSRFVNNQKIFELSEQIIKLTNYHGPINIDFRLDTKDKQLYLIEVNPRFWANVHHSLVCRVNFPAVALGLEKPTVPVEGKVYGEFFKTLVLIMLTADKKLIHTLPEYTLKQLTIFLKDRADIIAKKGTSL